MIMLIRSFNSPSACTAVKKPSLSNHPNRQDLGEKTDFLTWIGRRKGNFDRKLQRTQEVRKERVYHIQHLPRASVIINSAIILFC